MSLNFDEKPIAQYASEERDGMRIDWDVPIKMDDGNVVRADVYRPIARGRYPVIMSHGPYGKGLAVQEAYKSAWTRIIKGAPNVLEGSSNVYQSWEVVDPEKWVPDGYAVVRVDSRGAGRSPGYLDPYSAREIRDFYNCIEWAGVQAWSNGKVGLNGISYFAVSQWLVAGLQPPHLAALCVWEGCGDQYRDAFRHGGIMCNFMIGWAKRQVITVQHGYGDRGGKNKVTGLNVAGDETLPEDILAKNRKDMARAAIEREFLDDFYIERSANYPKVNIPLLSAANWGGMGLHTRGNFVGWERAGSKQKWLEVHGDSHFTPFYKQEGEALQKRFFGHFLKGEDTGWDQQPPVELNVRYPGEKFIKRAETEWPLARTEWTKFHLDPDTMSLGVEPTETEATLDYDTTGEGLLFSTGPLKKEMEITGPIAARFSVSSATTDADLFLVLRLFDPDGREVTFVGSNDPRVPIGLGWLRASHRKLDPELSTPWRPWHSHDEAWPLTPQEPVQVEVEIIPTSIVIPVGYSLALMIRGRDFEHPDDAAIPDAPYPMRGVGPFYHNVPADRPPEVFETTNTLHFGRDHPAYLLLPVIPAS